MSRGSGSDCKLPAEVMRLLLDEGAFLVGSGVPWFRSMQDKTYGVAIPKDLDLIVAPHNWSRVIRGLTNPRFNKFGGVSFETNDGWLVDIWPSTLDDYFRNVGFKTPIYAMSLSPYLIIERTNV